MTKQTTTQRIGPWVVTYEWDDQVAHGPVSVTVTADPQADPVDLIGGVTTSVLRQAVPVHPPRDDARRDRAFDLLRFAVGQYAVSSPEYLSALSVAYTNADPTNPSRELSELTAKAVDTVKAHLKAARREGLLTSNAHRPGGGLTPKGAEALAVVIKAANAAGAH
ncbi:hypothetical protein [Pseudonocardia alni]|uniref:hypothetical protein n=1 Tax=Pseudonocardia alni TaxID=33907 RepID=UPI00280C360B|nr:hypothetical protein [Pseudonocardia alni]